MIPIELSKHQALDGDPIPIQQINFTGVLDANATIVFIIKEVKETILYLSQGIVKIL